MDGLPFQICEATESRATHRREDDILSRVPRERVDIARLADLPLGEGTRGDFELRADLTGDELVAAAGAPGTPKAHTDGNPADYIFAACHLLHLVPIPWRGRELARRTFEALPRANPPERVAANRVLVLEALRRTGSSGSGTAVRGRCSGGSSTPGRCAS